MHQLSGLSAPSQASQRPCGFQRFLPASPAWLSLQQQPSCPWFQLPGKGDQTPASRTSLQVCPREARLSTAARVLRTCQRLLECPLQLRRSPPLMVLRVPASCFPLSGHHPRLPGLCTCHSLCRGCHPRSPPCLPVTLPGVLGGACPATSPWRHLWHPPPRSLGHPSQPASCLSPSRTWVCEGRSWGSLTAAPSHLIRIRRVTERKATCWGNGAERRRRGADSQAAGAVLGTSPGSVRWEQRRSLEAVPISESSW